MNNISIYFYVSKKLKGKGYCKGYYSGILKAVKMVINDNCSIIYASEFFPYFSVLDLVIL